MSSDGEHGDTAQRWSGLGREEQHVRCNGSQIVGARPLVVAVVVVVVVTEPARAACSSTAHEHSESKRAEASVPERRLPRSLDAGQASLVPHPKYRMQPTARCEVPPVGWLGERQHEAQKHSAAQRSAAAPSLSTKPPYQASLPTELSVPTYLIAISCLGDVHWQHPGALQLQLNEAPSHPSSPSTSLTSEHR
ncbi:hypothetical protein TOPH_00481 [Tolypocladium ophioglossoides CBS 100239]|uniref:Uncharacterized protein n=1 Tax=Tolypocladium ophioglossoides (strain CBS 100239) TaxID=1163406 RepID=A0A0L0NNM1_TOLOC|nr:hypothetical protein TOPH_00481 [Tolypocladium ophioglossoides CBS 100239]